MEASLVLERQSGEAARAPSPAVDVSAAAVTSKICMDPSSLVPGKFGDIALFDRPLDQDVGFMDAVPLRGIYLEHVISADSLTAFSPPNHPHLRCTPKGELYFVVGKHGYKTETFELDLEALPTYGDSDMVQGRNAKSLAELMRAPEVVSAGLLLAEVVALRLHSGPMYYIYNSILRDSLSTKLRGRASGLKWKSVGDTRPADGEELVHAALATALATLRAGDRVELHSLQAKPEYNGKCGTLVAFKAESGRWEVDLDGGGILHVKEANLTKAVGAQGKKAADGDASSGEADPAMVAKMLEILSKRAGQGAPVSSTNEVAVLHGKFAQDPNFRKAKFGSDDLFAMGLVAVVGPMDVQGVRALYNEHCTGSDACASFTAWNAGHVLETTPLQEWLFVVGREGVDLDSWQVVVGKAEPEVGAGMMVSGRNAKRLADLLQTGAARSAGLAPAEVIAVRLYTGPMYVKYNLVLRAGGHGCYATTIHIICSALQKLSRVTPPPLGLIVYRGTAGKCHFPFIHICMCACACVRACVRVCV